MPAADPLLCHRCHRPVEISHGQYEVFEHMHYVCFHYALLRPELAEQTG